MKCKKLLPSKRIVKILIMIAIIVGIAFFIHKGLGADQLKEDLMGSWYQTTDYTCSSFEITENDTDSLHESYQLRYNYDVLSDLEVEKYQIKFVNGNTLKIESWLNANKMTKHTIELNEDKTEMKITPAIKNDAQGQSETWYRGHPDSTILNKIENNKDDKQQKHKNEASAKEREKRMKDRIEITEFIYKITDYDRLDAYGIVTNNSAHAVKHIRINIDIIGKDTIELELPEDDAILYPGESVEFEKRHAGNKWVNSGDSCEIELIDYVIVD